MIRCGHCGGAHPTVADVRSCSAGQPAEVMAGSGGPPNDVQPAQRAPQRPAADVAGSLTGVGVDQLVGPDALGRSVLVGPDQETPTEWEGFERLVVQADGVDPQTLDALQSAWSNRTRLVVEVHGSIPEADPTLALPWWELDPELELVGERVRHLLTANAVDLRDETAPRFEPLEQALALGGTVEPDGTIATPTGNHHVDGGPLQWFDDTDLAGRVIPAANLLHRRLVPSPAVAPGAELAADQLAAVSHGGGGARIIAPAGSGKTRVLTERVRHLVADRTVAASGICLVAFNVRAREEMQERTRDLDGLEIRTLNSLALAICNGSGPFATPARHRRVEVIDEPKVRRLLDSLVKVRRQAMADPMAAWIEALTASRLGLRSPRAVEAEFGGDVKEFARLAPAYVEALDDRGLVDFDQQILRAIDILLTDTNARNVARRVCAQLLVDEFQDLTPAHLLLVRILGGPRAEVFGVGDDDQTIYGYSGASPQWLIDYADYFPGSASHDLQINYRCPPAVVEAAATLLTHNRRRVTKTINARPGRTDDDALHVLRTDDPASVLVDEIRSLLDGGAAPRDIAVLTRVNATLLAPLIALGEAGIATTKPVDVGFLQRTGIAGALAWLALATAPERMLPGDAIALAARRPPRALNPRVIEWMGEKGALRELGDLATRMRDERDARKIQDFVDAVALVRQVADDGGTTRELLETVRDEVGLGGALEKRLDASRRSVDRSSHGDDLAALLSIADLHPDPSDFDRWLAERLEHTEHAPGGVRLSTTHRVKGREWPHVMVYEATAGLFPHRLAEAVEEERRVFHVALTRGATSVRVICGVPPSSFVAQLDEPRDLDAPDPEPERPAAARSEGTERKRRRAVPEASTLEIASKREQLRTWRSTRAGADGVPAFVVFSDATLYELAEADIGTPDDLLDIKGIGPGKLEKYGEELMELLTP